MSDRKYKCLNKQEFSVPGFSIVPIRHQDRELIRTWRNEQIFHLRQRHVLTETDQEKYFSEVIAALFDQEQPAQILFSFLNDGVCIGYGGLVHINWIDKNAEISFLMDTSIEGTHFEEYWITYLSLIEQIAFGELSLHKIFTYAFDLRPWLYKALGISGYRQEARLIEHCIFDQHYVDVLIHAKINTNAHVS